MSPVLLFASASTSGFGAGCTRTLVRRDVCVMARRPGNRKGKKNESKKKAAAARPAVPASKPKAAPIPKSTSNDEPVLAEDGLLGKPRDLTPESLMAYEPGSVSNLEGLGPTTKRRTPSEENEARADTDIAAAAAKSDAVPPPPTPTPADAESQFLESDAPRMKLPNLPDTTPGARSIRRRRRKQAAAESNGGSVGAFANGNGSANAKSDSAEADAEASEVPLPTREIERLTRGYRTGEDAELLRKIEVEPDYMFKSGQAEGEYELASAIIGTGRPNNQGVYTQPYVQSAHIVLVAVLLLGANVYYPGFPLTEGSEELRANVRLALGLVYAVNAALALYAYGEAKKRRQPPILWTLKVALLGNIALQELKDNAPIDSEKEAKMDKAAQRRMRQRK